MLGTRLADAVLEVLEVLAEATYARAPAKAQLLAKANRRIESVRWLVRVCKDRNLLSAAQAGDGEGRFTMKSMKDMKGGRRSAPSTTFMPFMVQYPAQVAPGLTCQNVRSF